MAEAEQADESSKNFAFTSVQSFVLAPRWQYFSCWIVAMQGKSSDDSTSVEESVNAKVQPQTLHSAQPKNPVAKQALAKLVVKKLQSNREAPAQKPIKPAGNK